MRTHTNEFKEKIKLFGRQIKGKIIYYPSYDLVSEDDDNILTENDLQLISEQANYDKPIEIDEENIFSISIIKNGDLLQSLMKEFDFEAKDELNIGSVVNPHLGLLIDEDNQEYEYLDYRNYIIYSKEFNMDTETWSYVCYDKMLFAMVKYKPLSNVNFPITIKQFINLICNKVGLEFEDSAFVNQDQLIYEDLYKDKGLTYRDVFDEISKIVAGNLLINDNDELEVGYAHKVGEISDVSNSSIEIESEEESELVNFELEGKTTQETRSGKNLFDLTNFTTQSSNGITVTPTFQNNSLLYLQASGTYSQITYITLTNTQKLTPNTTYILSGAFSASARLRLREYSSNNTNLSEYWDTGSGLTFTTNANVDHINIQIVFYAQNNVKFYPMIRLASITDNSYEPYGAMPSPDYPSELVSVGYENLYENSQDFSGVWNNSSYWETNNETYNGLVVKKRKSSWSGINKDLNVESGKTYTFSVYIKSDTARQIALYTSGGTSGITSQINYTTSTDWKRYTLTFTATASGTIRPRVENTSASDTNYTYICGYQLEEDTQAHSYIPYGKYGIEVTTTGKNLANIEEIKVGKYWNGGTNYQRASILDIPIQPNTQYSIVGSYTDTHITNIRVVTFANLGAVDHTGVFTGTFTAPATAHYLSIEVLANTTFTSDMLNGIQIMLCEGTATITEYEPYQSNTQLYTLNNPLRAIGDTKDLLYIENGMLYVDRKIGDVVLDGSESWNYYTDSGINIFYASNIINSIGNYSDVLSNYFVCANSYAEMIAKIGTVTIRGDGKIIYLTSSITSVADFKTWLTSNNTEVQYVLAEPYTEELGEIDMPSTYEGITYIDTTDANTPTMNISYISEFEAIDEEYLNDTNVKISEKVGVINSVAILDTDNNLQYLAEDTDSIKENEMTRITITDNLMALNGDTQTIADNILNKLNGLYYYTNDLTTTGVCYYDYLDLFNVKFKGDTYKCLLLNNEITISQGIEEHIFTEKFEESETSSNEYTTSVMSDKQVSFMINKQQGEISSKVSKGDVVSEINQSADLISIKSNRIEIESDNFALTQDGTIKAVSGEIGGFVIGEKQLYGLHKKIDIPYTNSDLTNIRNYIMGTGTLTDAQLEFYDYNKDGVVNTVDYVMIYDLIQNSTKEYTIELNSQYVDKMLNIYDENGEQIIKIGVNGGNFSNLQINNKLDFGNYTSGFHTSISDTSDTFMFEFDGTKNFGQIQLSKNTGNVSALMISLNGLTGNISCVSLTQTSKAENKKNFEKLTNAKEILNATDIYKYNFKDEEDNTKKSIGFVIGDDFNYSEEITSNNNDGANIYSMVSVLWQVVKEQQEEIEKLKEMINNGKS